MSTTIYLIRHGQSVANENNAFLGHGDLPLTEIGHQQARSASEFLKQKKVADAIYSSDLLRAYYTAKPTADRLNLPIVKDEALREIYAGKWEKVAFDTIAERYTESFHTWTTDIGNARCDGGESVVELQARVVGALKRIAEENPDRVVYVFTHATPIRVFAAHCLQKTPDEFKDVPWAGNASITEAIYDGESFNLVKYGENDFMGDLATKLPANV